MYELACPWLLLLWFLPIVVFKCLKPVSVDYKFSIKVPFYQQYMQYEQDHLSGTQSCMWLYHWIAIWGLLVFALAGPRWVGPPQSLSSEARNIMLVLDISGSMGLQDMPSAGQMHSRWSVVKNKALDFVSRRPEDKIGLILFGERAYLFAPLTHDQSTLKQRINDASVGLAGQATALGDAMGLAIKHLKSTPAQARVMILLTDGVANAGVLSPLKAANFAKQQKIKIYAIGLGPQSNGKTLSGIFWQLQHANDLDENTLRKIANLTNGKYYRANDAQSLNAIYQDIERLEPVKLVRHFLRTEKEYFYWPLTIALAWMLVLFVTQIIKDRRVA